MSADPTDVQRALVGLDYPAAKEAIVRHAETEGAPDRILRQLRDIPPRTYDDPTSVMEEFADDLGG